MNYLAHAYLSFKIPELLVGNIISDFVKGKKKFEFSPAIQEGISLHRAIDHFTDTHPASKKAKEILKPSYGLYSAAFVDVVYDHFLANDTKEFINAKSLYNFSQEVYEQLDPFIPIFPVKFQLIYPYMKQYNWLFNYKHQWGIDRSFAGLAKRATYLTESETAYKIFLSNYHEFENCYNEFFFEVKEFAWNKISSLNYN